MDLNQFTDKQKEILKQFREVVKDCKLPDADDTYLIRWLIARDFDLAKSEKMLRNSLEWRRRNRIDAIEDFQTPEVLCKYFATGFIGRDKLYNPVWLVRYGRIEIKDILHAVKKKDYITHVINLVETSMSMVLKNPTRYRRSRDAIVQSTIIFDMDQFSIRHITYKPAMEAAFKIIQIYEANYPELLYRVFVINAPKVFSLAFSMIKPLLHERTRNKINILSHDPKQWKAALLDAIDPEELPESYGGTLTDPDGNPNCATLVNMGGKVPKSYYFSGKLDTTNKKLLTISSGSKELLEFQVEKVDSVLKWDFHSEDEIVFAVYKKQGSELIPIVPRDRVDCQMSAEEGEIRCDETGVYVVEFDNGPSFLRKVKKVWYSISVDSASTIAQTDTNDLDHI